MTGLRAGWLAGPVPPPSTPLSQPSHTHLLKPAPCCRPLLQVDNVFGCVMGLSYIITTILIFTLQVGQPACHARFSAALWSSNHGGLAWRALGRTACSASMLRCAMQPCRLAWESLPLAPPPCFAAWLSGPLQRVTQLSPSAASACAQAARDHLFSLADAANPHASALLIPDMPAHRLQTAVDLPPFGLYMHCTHSCTGCIRPQSWRLPSTFAVINTLGTRCEACTTRTGRGAHVLLQHPGLHMHVPSCSRLPSAASLGSGFDVQELACCMRSSGRPHMPAAARQAAGSSPSLTFAHSWRRQRTLCCIGSPRDRWLVPAGLLL